MTEKINTTKIFLSSAPHWAATINLTTKDYKFFVRSQCHIRILVEDEDSGKVHIEFLTSNQNKKVNKSNEELFTKICKYFEQKGVKLTYKQVRKIVLSLEKIK